MPKLNFLVYFFDITAVVVTLSALFAVLNHHTFRLPTTIGVMLISLVLSSAALIFKALGLFSISYATKLVEDINFSQTLVSGMLGALLFAGALQINYQELKSRLSIILILSTFGVLVSTALVGTLIYGLCLLLKLDMSLMYCLAFGALISPTDPIAVLAILKKVGVSKWLELDVTGESLFNDGIGYVVFTLLISLAIGDQTISKLDALWFFAHEAVGGIAFGFLISFISYLLIKYVNDYHIEILVTIALVIGGYNVAETIGVSAPLAIVIAGIMTGNVTRKAMQFKSKKYISIFWEIVDELLNCILFVLLGLEILVINWDFHFLYLGVAAIITVLFCRWVSVAIPVSLLKKHIFFSPRSIKLLTWGGLRGGLSVAMAMTIPNSTEKDIILIMTYACVIFAILIQGTTIKYIAGERTVRDDGTLRIKK